MLADLTGEEKLPTFLSQFRLSLLDRGNNHVTGSRGGQSVQSRTNAKDGNDEQVLGTRVISAVHNCADWQSQRHAELGTLGSLRHLRKI